MNSKEATKEFVHLLRVGSAALLSVLRSDKNIDVRQEVDEIRFLIDSLDEVSDRLEKKLHSDRFRGAG